MIVAKQILSTTLGVVGVDVAGVGGGGGLGVIRVGGWRIILVV